MFLKTMKQRSDNKEGRQGYVSLRIVIGQSLANCYEQYLLIHLQLIFQKSIVSTNTVGKNQICGSWNYLPKIVLQIFHSVSGNVIFKYLKPSFLCLSGISCEVKCTVREFKLQTVLLIKAVTRTAPLQVLINLSYPCHLILVITMNTVISNHGFRFVSHKLQDDGMIGPNKQRPVFQTKMMEQFRFFDLRLSCYFL